MKKESTTSTLPRTRGNVNKIATYLNSGEKKYNIKISTIFIL